MKSVPFVMFRRALRLAMDEVFEGWESHSVLRQERVWNLFFLVPRMLLSRRPRGGLIPRNKLEFRLAAFAAGHWIELIDACGEMCWKAKEAMVRRSRRQGSMDMNVARAERLAMMGESVGNNAESSTARIWLQATTLQGTLTRQDRRPALPREPPPRDLMEKVHGSTMKKCAKNFCSARRGAAPGPSDMTTEHLFPLFESTNDTQAFCQLGNLLAQGSATRSVVHHKKREDDTSGKTKWSSARNCCGRHIPSFGGTNNCTTSPPDVDRGCDELRSSTRFVCRRSGSVRLEIKEHHDAGFDAHGGR